MTMQHLTVKRGRGRGHNHAPPPPIPPPPSRYSIAACTFPPVASKARTLDLASVNPISANC
jgi:hypothetical protein